MTSGPILQHNIATATRLIHEAVLAGAKLVLLPEYWAIMGLHEHDKVRLANSPDAQLMSEFMAQQARHHGIYLIGGTVPLTSPEVNKVYNSTLVFNPTGQQVARYDKIHLFGFTNGAESYQESLSIVAGSKPVSFGTNCEAEIYIPLATQDTGYKPTILPPDRVARRCVGTATPPPRSLPDEKIANFYSGILNGEGYKVGLSICYDLRFPELYRSFGVVDLIVVPSAFTYTTGSSHWEILLRARAIENQCYVLAAAQTGHHPNGRRTWGHSMLIDPWGKIVAELPESEGVVVGAMDSQLIQEIRRNLPALQHRVLPPLR